MDLDEILGQVMPHDDGYVEPVAEKTFEQLGEFKLSTTKDKEGLPVEDKSYIKRSCKDCYGRGYQIQSFGGRRYQTCSCVNRGYVKARREHEAKLARIKKTVEREALAKHNAETKRSVATLDEIVKA